MTNAGRLQSALDAAQDSVKFYLQVTGGPSSELCAATLKFVDFLRDLSQGRDPTDELERTALTLMRAVADGVRERLAERCPKSLSAAIWWCTNSRDYIDMYWRLKQEVTEGLRVLASSAVPAPNSAATGSPAAADG